MQLAQRGVVQPVIVERQLQQPVALPAVEAKQMHVGIRDARQPVDRLRLHSLYIMPMHRTAAGKERRSRVSAAI